MRVLFWGSPEFAVPFLEAVDDSGRHGVAAVVTQPDKPRGRGRKELPPPVKKAALGRGITVLQPRRPRGDEFIARIRGLEPDVSLVVAYGHILLPEVLEVPAHGSINLHASLLPAWRGAAPIQRAVAACDTRTGLTVIRMDEGMDTGPVLDSRGMEILPGETAGELSARMMELGPPLVVDVLDRLEQGSISATPQPEEGVSHAPKVSREEARVDWTRPARNVACTVRGFDPVPGAWTLHGGEVLKLFRALEGEPCGNDKPPGEIVGAGEEGLAVCCGDSRTVLVREVQAEGRKRMEAAAFLRGARITPGDRLGEN